MRRLKSGKVRQGGRLGLLPTTHSLYLVLFTGLRPYYSSCGQLLFIFAHQNSFHSQKNPVFWLNITTVQLVQHIVTIAYYPFAEPCEPSFFSLSTRASLCNNRTFSNT